MNQEAKPDMTLKQRFVYRATHLSLSAALSLVILTACLLVAAGYTLYERDTNRKYDIARPGQRDENKVLNVEDQEADTTSPVTPTVVKRKLENFDKETKALSTLNDFSQEDLADQTIQLVQPDQPSL